MTLLSCADRLATRGRNAEAAIAAHLELARELMGAALAWRADGPPAAPLRGDELARELGHARPGPSSGGCCGGSRRPRSPARRAIASRRCYSPGPCARIPTGDRRLRDLRGRTPARRQGGPAERLQRVPRVTARFAWIGLYEPSPAEFESLAREFDLHPLAVEDAIHAHQRPKLEVFGDDGAARAQDRPLRGPARGREAGGDPRVRGTGLRDHGPPRGGQRPARRARAPRGQAGAAQVGPRGRGARDRGQGGGRLPARDRRPRGGRGAGGDRGVLARAAGPHGAHLQAQARDARLLPRRRSADSARSTRWPAGTTT